jgi:hypothetical protein
MISILDITDGTTRIPLLSASSGFYLDDWKPATAEPKGGGVWQESPFVDGRRLAMKQYGNITDTFSVGIQGASADDCIFWAQEMRRMLRKAAEYWTTDWQNEPVWIEAIGECEGEGDVSTTHPHVLDLDSLHKRYAIIMDGRFPNDDNPYKMPMAGSAVGEYAMTDLVLSIEHQYWMAQEPMTADCVQVRNHNKYPWVMWLSPDIDVPAAMYSASATFDNMPDADFTAEIWVYGNLGFAAGTGYLFWKSGWYAKVNAGRTISCFADFTGVDASLTTVNALPVNPQGMTHIAIKFTHANHRFSVAIGGVAAGGAPVDGTVNYVGDAATDFYVASTSAAGTGLFSDRTTVGSRMTWARISNSVRADALGTRVYNKLPDYDVNTICLTNGCYTWAGGNIAWVNSFAPYYTNNILNYGSTRVPTYGLLGVENYLENYSSFFCDFERAYSINADREGCGLDYAFWADTTLGTFGPNVIDNTNFQTVVPPVAAVTQHLFPTAAIQVGDYFYFGCGVYQGNAIPQAVVFEFLETWDTGNIFTLEYYDSVGVGWAAVPNYMSTAAYEKTTLLIITEPPSAVGAPIGATTINGYYAYWYRMNFTGVTGAQMHITAGPALISSPSIEIENNIYIPDPTIPLVTTDNEIHGDLAAIARISYNAELELHNSVAAHVRARRALLSLYSHSERDINMTSRLNWFTPYINLTREVGLLTTKPKNQPGIQMTAVRAAGAYTTIYDITAPATWITQVRVVNPVTEYITIAIYDYASLSFQGKFRVMARMRDVLGGAAKGAVTVSVHLTSPYNIHIGGQAQPVPVLEELLDFGIIDLPAVGEGRSSEKVFTLVFTALTAGNHDINLHDLILWPIDEWNAEIEHQPVIALSTYPAVNLNLHITLLDPFINPKSPRSAVDGTLGIGTISPAATIPLDRDEIEGITGLLVSMSDSYPKLQANRAQKLYNLQGMQYTITTPTNILYTWPYFYARAWTIEKQERYESMRGNR